MGKNSTVSIGIAINGKQAEMQMKALENEVNRITESLTKMEEKLHDKKTWGPGDTEDTIKRSIKDLERNLKTAKQLYRSSKSTIKGIEEVLTDISNANYNELTRTRGLLQSSIKSLDPTTEKYKQKVRELQELRDEIAKRDVDVRSEITFDRAKEVLAKPNDYSVKTINEAVAVMTKFRDIQTAGSEEWNHWNGYVQNGTKFIEEFNASVKQMKMEDLHLKLYEADPSISDNDLNTLVRYWEAMAAGADKGTKELEYYNQKLKEGRDLMQQRTVEKTSKVMADPAAYSVDEINQAIEATKKLQATQQPGSDAWKTYGEQIANAKNLLDQFNNEVKESAMKKQLATPNSLSPQALSEQKKYWQEMINTTDLLNPKLVEYKNNLQQVVEEEQIRAKLAAETMMSQVDSGAWKGTIGDTQEAIKQLKEYRTMLDATDAPGLKRVDEAVAALNQRLKETEQGYMSIADALAQADNVGAGTFDGTIEDLEILKKRLEEIRQKEIKIGAPDADKKIKKIDNAISDVSKRIDTAKEKSFDLDHTLENLSSASFNDLTRAAELLQKQISECTTESTEFVIGSQKLRDVSKQLDEIKGKWKEKENIIVRASKQIVSYVAAYAGINEIAGQLKRVINANIELSDSLADIQKTTGLTEKQVAGLSDAINKIDTRTAQQQLHELAYEAGKLGISAEEDVLSFVKAGNQIMVALGEDLGGAEAIRELMKVNAILGETQNLGMEKALLATGSAINEIAQTSRADAGPIADMVSRIGAIGAAAKLQMSDLIALAGTADAMGQSAEVAGTAFNKFITTLQTNTIDVAYALGLDPKRLQDLMNTGDTMQAIVEIFERMNEMGDLSSLGGIFKDLGSEGARMSQVLVTMASGIDELKAQVFTSSKAFKEATSVTNEYNIKNESAAAILERMGNNLRENLTNSGFVEWIRDVLHWLYYLPQRIEENRVAFWALSTIMIQIATVSSVKLIKSLGGALIASLKNLNISIGLSTGLWKKYYLVIAKNNFNLVTTSAIKSAGAVTKLKIAFQTLGRILIKNPIFLIGTALTVAITAFRAFRKEIDESTAAAMELETAIQNEQYTMRRLLTDINNANGATGERAALIKQLNDKYGQYLGFVVTESNYVENQAYIYDLLNAKLRESIALKMNSKMMEDIASKNEGNRSSANRDILEGLYGITDIGEVKAPEYMAKIMDAILKQTEKGTKNIQEVLRNVFGNVYTEYIETKEELDKAFAEGSLSSQAYQVGFSQIKRKYFGEEADRLFSGVFSLLDVEAKISREVKNVQTITNANLKAMQASATDITRKHLDEQYASITDKTDVKTLQTIQQKTQAYIKEQKNGIVALEEQKLALKGLTIAEQEEFEKLNQLIGKTAENVGMVAQGEETSVKPAQELLDRWNLLNKKKEEGLRLSDADEQKIADTNAEIMRMEENLQTINKRLMKQGAFNIWGNSDEQNLAANSPKQLVAMYKKLEADAARLSKASFKNIGEATAEDGKKYVTQFWKNFNTREEAIDWYKIQKNEIAKQLKELGYNTSGKFLGLTGDGDTDNEQKRETRKEYQAAMSALEAYYKEREAMIREQGVKENALQSTIDKLVAKNTENLEKDRVELIKKLLGEENKFDPFANEGYKGVLTGNVFFGDTKNLDELAENIARWGLAMEDGMRNTLSASFIKVSKQAETEIQRMQKILLQDDFTEQVAQQYMESLDKLGLLFGLNEKELTDTTAEQGRQRLEAMREYADRSYSLTAEKLEEEMKQNALFDAWNIDRKREHYEVLLGELRKFHDDQIEADKKTAERRKKIADARFKASGQQGAAEGNIKDSEAKLDFAKKMNEFGVGGEQVVNELEIEVLKQKIAYEQQWLALLAQESAAKQKQLEQDIANAELLMQKENDEAKRQELNNQLNQLRQQLASEQNAFAIASADSIDRMLEYQKNAADIYSQQFTGYFDKLKDYQSNIDSFAQSMGEGIFGSKEDRQQAGRELLASVLTTSKNLIQVWLTQLATRRLVDEMEVKQTEATEMRKRAIKLQSMIQDGTIAITGLSVDAAKTEASILLSSAEAAGKEAAKKGLIGLAVGAAISAALSALLGAALGKVNQSKAEIASATGASGGGKLATGMLTYAEGNYPVLGNDGKVYNARYEGKGMKTGVYGGGAHFGIFSEKQPEAIIDGKTTQRLMLNYPEIWKSIVTLSRVGKIERGMRTFATGNIQEIAAAATTADGTVSAAQYDATLAMMNDVRALMSANMALMNKLATDGVKSSINMYGDGGMYKSMEKAGKFAKRRGY